MASDFRGKIALVTGAGSGIGRAAAQAFARTGAAVVVADSTDEAGRETERLITEAGGTALFARADVTRADEVKAMVARAVAEFGGLDYAFNNAGSSGELGTTTATISETSWQRTIDVNLKSVFLCMKYEVPALLQRGGGAIVNNASLLGLVGSPTYPAYVASKHAVVGLTRAAAMDYATDGIRINVVCPGITRTPMAMSLSEEARAGGIVACPMGRMAEPEEVANAVLWLCSEDASFVTAVPLPVDGGYAQ